MQVVLFQLKIKFLIPDFAFIRAQYQTQQTVANIDFKLESKK